jgi:hypothetical protein
MLTGYDAIKALQGTAADDRSRFNPGDSVTVYSADGTTRAASYIKHYTAGGAFYDECAVAIHANHGKPFPVTAVRAVFIAHAGRCGCDGCAAVRRVRGTR